MLSIEQRNRTLLSDRTKVYLYECMYAVVSIGACRVGSGGKEAMM